MPAYFKIFNSFPSFVNEFEQNGATHTNPLPNYGSLMGAHLQDYCENRMSETPAGGYNNLVAFLASETSLTGINQSSLTGMCNHLSVAFGITTGTQGYALLDFRGNSWKYIVGDGIIGPTNITNSTAHTSTKASAIAILNHFKNQYPDIKWAFAGLPNLPHFTTYASVTGSSPTWATGLTNNGGANNHWDPTHPTLPPSTNETFYNWQYTPTALKSFYLTQSNNVSESILNASGWACPDINPTISDTSSFGRFMYSVTAKHVHSKDVVSLGVNYSSEQNRVFNIMPLVNSVYRSRESDMFDSPMGYFTDLSYLPGASGEIATIFSGFTGAFGPSGTSAFAADCIISIPTLKAGMLEPAAVAGSYGFVYQDTIPMMITIACTGSTQSDERMTQSIERARNFIAQQVYNTSDTTTIPWTTVATELKGHFSYETIAYQLRAISEAIPVGDTQWQSLYSEENPKIPTGPSSTIPNYDSSNWESDLPFTPPTLFGVAESCCPGQGACCVDGTFCFENTESECRDLEGVWSGGLFCANIPECVDLPPIGVCCFPGNPNCVETTESVCVNAGGVWDGNASCATSLLPPCITPTLGSCCDDEFNCVDDVAVEDCVGTWSQFPCGFPGVCEIVPPDLTGQCCVDGVCMEDMLQSACALVGGFWFFAECNPVDCAPIGSCCHPTNGCSDTTEGDCVGGTWDEIRCDSLNPPCIVDPFGFCCAGGLCTFKRKNNCESNGGVWHATDALCLASCETIGACCEVVGSISQCTATTELNCGGDWTSGTCSQVICAPVGACCLDDINCENLTEANCTTRGGLSWSQGVLCNTGDHTCAPILGSCCESSVCVFDVPESYVGCIPGTWTSFAEGGGCNDGTTNCDPVGGCCVGASCSDQLKSVCEDTGPFGIGGVWHPELCSSGAFNCGEFTLFTLSGSCCYNDPNDGIANFVCLDMVPTPEESSRCTTGSAGGGLAGRFENVPCIRRNVPCEVNLNHSPCCTGGTCHQLTFANIPGVAAGIPWTTNSCKGGVFKNCKNCGNVPTGITQGTFQFANNGSQCPGLECVAVRWCAEDTSCDGENTFRICKEYLLEVGNCCASRCARNELPFDGVPESFVPVPPACGNTGPYPAPLAAPYDPNDTGITGYPADFCNQMIATMKCGEDGCGQCDDVITLTEQLRLCCSSPCRSTQHLGGGNGSTACSSSTPPCNCLLGPAWPVLDLLSSMTVSDAVKSSIVEDVFGFSGRSSFSTYRSQGNFQNNTIRYNTRIEQSLSLFAPQGSDTRLSYLNLKTNYTPTERIVSRIQSEFAFNRFFLPNSYS